MVYMVDLDSTTIIQSIRTYYFDPELEVKPTQAYEEDLEATKHLFRSPA